MIRFIKKNYTIIVIALVYLWACVSIITYQIDEAPPGIKTIRIGHWQLETGVRDAFIELAKDYAKIHPDVKVIQDAIPESVYGQWTSTQLMGETGPDILEMGMAPTQVLLSYYNRYMIPLSSYASNPNPYNKGNEFENLPLRQTYKDGMRSGYLTEMQEYMQIPLSMFAVRIFYNKDLLKKLTGSDKVPRNFAEFKKACQIIERQKNSVGKQYVPIVGSKYHFGLWEWAMCDVLSYGVMDKADFNRDGYVGNDELYIAVKTGRMDFNYEPFKAKFQMVRELSNFCQPGYTGLSRDEGVFLFVQQKAVFMTTGTWDANSLVDQTKGKFEVGLMDFPLPDKNDPEYGNVIKGPRYEQVSTGFPFAIMRNSKNLDTAIDFMLFLTSKENNEKLNKIIGWIPAIKNTRTDPFLADFEPRFEGIYGNSNLFLGGETWIKWMQVYSNYQCKKISYDELVREFEPFYKEKGLYDFMELQMDWKRTIIKKEAFITALWADANLADPVAAKSFWTKYRTQAARLQVFPEIDRAKQMCLVEKGPTLNSNIGPYEYSPEVIQKIKSKLKNKNK